MVTPIHRTPADDPDTLLTVLRRALEAHADDDGDPHGGTPAGRALLRLAARARTAAARLGADPGTTLTGGAGVVVLRDLAVATRLLERTVAQRAREPQPASEAAPEAA